MLRSSGETAVPGNTELFFDYLYATLASWGMHRMGKGKTKLRDLPAPITTPGPVMPTTTRRPLTAR